MDEKLELELEDSHIIDIIGLPPIPGAHFLPKYYWHSMCNYARALGMEPVDLTEEEVEMFRIYENE
ncbi:hypothetical protein [Granulicatella seriolae]|uniref:Uncharacterized protein n=1 Tax=Granulicatella seriolae TaxID=2967226 RepID=A0ABT1WRH0_9LACT|nr:hypothetical protein [Granulicatella seriolae]